MNSILLQIKQDYTLLAAVNTLNDLQDIFQNIKQEQRVIIPLNIHSITKEFKEAQTNHWAVLLVGKNNAEMIEDEDSKSA